MENSHLLISGATSGIGKELVRLLAPNYKLLLHGRDNLKLAVLKNQLDLIDTRCWIYDLTDVDGIQNSLKEILITEGISISGFIHCAGTLRILPIKNFRLDYTRDIFNVNFFSTVEIIKTLLLKSNFGLLNNIVFISAVYSKFGNKGNSIYAASKGALDSFVKSLAVELAPNVRVNSILPGGLRTRMTNYLFENPEYMLKFNEKYLLGEGSGADIAAMVKFLISSEAKWITGQHFVIDGGCSSHL